MLAEHEMQAMRRQSLPLLVGATALALGLTAIPAMHQDGGAARDQQRVVALLEIDRAIHAYEELHGEPPDHVPDPQAGGWETTRDGFFLDLLVRDGLLTERLLDPVNDEQLQFRYHRYEPDLYGTEKPFYVLALTGFEDEGTVDQLPPIRTRTSFGGRDWGLEFPLVLTSR